MILFQNFLQRFRPVVFPAAAVNSAYLVWAYGRGFFSEENVPGLVKDFVTPFYTLPIIFLSLYTISNIRRRVYVPERGHLLAYFLFILPLTLFFTLFLAVSIALLWFHTRDTPSASIQVMLSTLTEILAIVLAVGTQKTARLAKVFKLLFLWAFSVMGAFSVAGFYEKWHPGTAVSNDLKLVFSGIFFHAVNSIYLVYAGVRGYQSAQKKRVRRPMKQAA